MIRPAQWLCGIALASVVGLGAPLRVGVFRADVTPAPGEPLIWITPVVKVEDPLWAKGVVLEDGRARYVLCTIDWCGVGGSVHRLFREKLAAAAGTDVSRVTLHSVHQHTAPYVDGDAYRLLDQLPVPLLRMSAASLDRIAERIAAAARDAAARLQPFDRVGLGEAEVEQVASARRLRVDGKLVTRYSTGGRDPAIAALPEGPIDRRLKTITLAKGAQPIVRLHYYATHPQTFCCDGRVTADIVGAARDAVEQRDGVPQIYFTGCSGDVTAGKYNDGQAPARRELAHRLEAGMMAAIAATRLSPAAHLRWRTAALALPAKPAPEWRSKSGESAYRGAIVAAFAARTQPLEITALTIGPARIVHLPGEPMLEFQKYAQGLRPGGFVAVAGYGDMSTGYLCTDQAHAEGGYEPSASSAGPGTEAALKKAIHALLEPE